MSKARSLALNILNQYEEKGLTLNSSFSSRDSQNLSPLDHKLAFEITHGCLRYLNQLDWIIDTYSQQKNKSLPTSIRNILRMGIYQILYLDRVPDYAIVNTAVDLAKKFISYQKYINALLRNIIKVRGKIDWPKDEQSYLSLFYAHPISLVKRWLHLFGKEKAVELFKYNLCKPTLTLRINTQKIKPQDLLQCFNEKNIKVRPHLQYEELIYVESWPEMEESDLWQQGLFYVQDESMYIPLKNLELHSSLKVLDLCAAPGGKTTAIAQMLGPQGSILAVDQSQDRLQRLVQNVDRGAWENIQILVGDATEASGWIHGSFDRILVDAPCSNSGVFSKRVEAKWKFNRDQLERLSNLQLKILNEAVKMLKRDGILMYMTCSIDPVENIEVIKKLNDVHDDLKCLDQETIYPALDHDGGYWAKLTKTHDT